MDGDEDVGVEGADRLGPGLVEGAHLGHGGLPAKAVVGLVADLDHADVRPGVPDGLEARCGVFPKLLGLVADAEARPGLGHLLLRRVRPEVGVVEVHQELQAVLRRPGAELPGGLGGAVPAAVAAALRIEGVHPHPDPDVVDPVLREGLEHVLLLTVEAVVFDAAGLLTKEAGHVRPQDEIVPEVFDLLHVEGVRGNGLLLLHSGPPLPTAGQQQQRQNNGSDTFHGSLLL